MLTYANKTKTFLPPLSQLAASTCSFNQNTDGLGLKPFVSNTSSLSQALPPSNFSFAQQRPMENNGIGGGGMNSILKMLFDIQKQHEIQFHHQQQQQQMQNSNYFQQSPMSAQQSRQTFLQQPSSMITNQKVANAEPKNNRIINANVSRMEHHEMKDAFNGL
jgi:hypothetical protein